MNPESFFLGYEPWLFGVVPRLGASLREPSGDLAIDQYEVADVPDELRQLWRVHDGESGAENLGGVIGGLQFLGVEESRAEWEMWAALRADSSESELRLLSSVAESVPPGAIQCEYSVPGWVPVLKESMMANYLGLDLSPGPQGTRGQVINFGRDEDRKRVISNSLSDLLGFLWSEVEDDQFVVTVARPSGEQVLTHRRGGLIGVLCELAESRGPLR